MRFASLLLVIAMSWSGFALREPAVPAAMTGAAQADVLSAGGSAQRLDDGSMRVHLDAQLAQAHAESMPDLPDLIVGPAESAARGPGMSCYHPYAASAPLPLYLGGPEPPPRASAAVA